MKNIVKFLVHGWKHIIDLMGQYKMKTIHRTAYGKVIFFNTTYSPYDHYVRVVGRGGARGEVFSILFFKILF